MFKNIAKFLTIIVLIGLGMLILVVIGVMFSSGPKASEALPTINIEAALPMAWIVPTASLTGPIPTWTTTLDGGALELDATQEAPQLTLTSSLTLTPASPTPPSETPNPIPTWTATLKTVAFEPSATQEASQLTPTSTPTLAKASPTSPSKTPSPTPTWTATLKAVSIDPSPTSTRTPTPAKGSISGRVIVNGVPASGVNLTLENQENVNLASVQTGTDGTFQLSNLAAYPAGYSLVFAQDANPQFALDKVVSWSWIDAIPMNAGASEVLPDFEIGLSGLGAVNPAPDSIFSAAAVSAGNPLLFTWTTYNGAARYWVDLTRGEEQVLVWKSALVNGPPVAFDGLMFGGVRVKPDGYWWGVGALRPFGSYTQTVYSYLVGFSLDP